MAVASMVHRFFYMRAGGNYMFNLTVMIYPGFYYNPPGKAEEET
jgi:hypothetical protein